MLLIPIALVIVGLTKHRIDLNTFKKGINELPEIVNSLEVNGTKVHIIGTVHFETEKIKRQDLYHIIDSISPSIILYESDASTVKRMLKKRDYFFRLLRVFQNKKRVENPVALTYIENNPNCIILPYEWELRDKYHRKHKLNKNSSKLINSVIGLYKDNQLTKDQSSDIEKFLEINKLLSKIGKNGTISDINSFSTDTIVKQRQNYIYSKIPEITKVRKELTEYLDFAAIHMSYWDTRNKAMAQNILKQIQLNPNKVIVVLNGFYHRYYLIEELKKYEAEYEFTLK